MDSRAVDSVKALFDLQQKNFEEELAIRDKKLAELTSRNAMLEITLKEFQKARENNEWFHMQPAKEHQHPNMTDLSPVASSSTDTLAVINAIYEQSLREPPKGNDKSTNLFSEYAEKLAVQHRKAISERQHYKTAFELMAERFVDEVRKAKEWMSHYEEQRSKTTAHDIAEEVTVLNPDRAVSLELGDSDQAATGCDASTSRNPSEQPVQANQDDSDMQDVPLPSEMSELHEVPSDNIAGRSSDIQEAENMMERKQDENRQNQMQNMTFPNATTELTSSTQGTEDETEYNETTRHTTTRRELSQDDEPIVVFQRSLKRKRIGSPQRQSKKKLIEDGEGSMAEPVRIKEESFDLSNGAKKSARPFRRTETSDLDAIGSRIFTPRHQRSRPNSRRAEKIISRQPLLEALRQGRSTSLPLEALTEAREEFEGGVDGVHGNHVGSYRQRDTNEIEEDRAFSEPLIPSVAAESSGKTSRNSNGINSVLTPLNPNTNHGRRTNIPIFLRKDTSSSFQSGADVIPMITEDGEDAPPTRRTRRSDGKAAAAMLQTRNKSSSEGSHEKHSRLQSLLESSSPIHAPLSDRRSHGITGRSRVHGKDSKSASFGVVNDALVSKTNKTTEDDKQRQAERGDATVSRPTTSAKFRIPPSVETPKTNIKQSTSAVPQHHTPLRFLPTSALKKSDFKPNPKVNDNLAYAYHETVRNRDARRCLPGCTDPKCCGGAWLRLAEAGLLPSIEPDQGLWSSTPEEDVDADTRLLASFLGISTNAVGKLSDMERTRNLNLAKAEQFAHKYGKHRQRFERRSTPPGFWETDFPGTQTQVRNQREAEAMDRERIERMAREARRENGRFMFRDEV
ncbi:MAG: hypothetical protein M1820_008551 [Bogoriella megaspora]|nr:MAG: hypothetical protein M1820_008551 [Bogoriella megaspora]